MARLHLRTASPVFAAFATQIHYINSKFLPLLKMDPLDAMVG